LLATSDFNIEWDVKRFLLIDCTLVDQITIDKVEDGKIVEHGGALNTFEALFEAKIIQPAP